MSGFAKVFAGLWDGTLANRWETWSLFVFMLAHADAHGVVDMTAEAMARRSCIPVEKVREALAVLEAPDPESRTPDDDGRRIVRLDAHRSWGWVIVNHAKYRARRDEETRREEARERMRRKRAERPEEGNLFAPVRHGSPSFAQAEAEAEAEADTDTPSSLRSEGSPERGDGAASDSSGKASSSTVGARLTPAEERDGQKGSGGAVATYTGLVGGLRGLPVVGGGDWVPTAEHVEAWRAAYPGVDLTREWAAMRSWLLANPTRGKTRRGMAAFVNRWLGKAQDDSGRTVRPGGGGARAGADARYLEGNKGKVGGVLNMGGDND